MQRNDIFYPMLTYPARGSREPQIKVEPIDQPYQPRSILPRLNVRKTKKYPHKLGKRQIKEGKLKKKKLPFIEDREALWRHYKKVVANQEVMHVGDTQAEAFFRKWKKVTKKEYDKNDALFHELQAFVIQYGHGGFIGRSKR